jgi:hypothetical protein
MFLLFPTFPTTLGLLAGLAHTVDVLALGESFNNFFASLRKLTVLRYVSVLFILCRFAHKPLLLFTVKACWLSAVFFVP